MSRSFNYTSRLVAVPSDHLAKWSKPVPKTFCTQHKSTYQCDVCGREYSRKFNLRKHITKFHLHSFCPSSTLPDESDTLKYLSKITHPSGTLQITLNIADVDTIHKWIEEYGRLNNAIYVRRASSKNKNKTTVYYEQNSCQHYHQLKNGKRKKRTKGRECPSKILVSVKTTKVSEITLAENHNHPLDSAEILHYRKPTEAVKNQFEELFNIGLGPAAAYKKFVNDIKNECCSNNEWMQKNCDRSKVPDLPWVYKFFKKKFEEKYGTQESYIKFVTSKFEFNHSLQLTDSCAEKQNDIYYIATGERKQHESLPEPQEEVIFSSVQDSDMLHQDDIPNSSYSNSEDRTSITESVINVGDISSSSFKTFIQEVNAFCKKFEGRADVAEALDQAINELKKLQNGTAAEAILALKCFNRNLSY